MSDATEKRGFRPRFRWKYAFSAFLVFGVLSITIGKGRKPVEDPLLIRGQALTEEFDRTFKVNKDPKTATPAELDGPEYKTFPLDSPVLDAFVKKLAEYGRFVSSESFARAKFGIADPRVVTTAAAAVIYEELQVKIYANYMRLAHDAEFRTFRKQSLWQRSDLLAAIRSHYFGAGAAKEMEYQNWLARNKAALKTDGARAFSPYFYDFLNIRLDPKTAQVLYADTEKLFNKVYNIRSVRDPSGHYTQVELFVNAFEKQMAEYRAIEAPKDKGEYLKLLQFAAIREAMSNRRAIRRLGAKSFYLAPLKASHQDNLRAMAPPLAKINGEVPPPVRPMASVPVALSDQSINACAPDLVSFRSGSEGAVRIDDLESYSSLWQQDRHADLMDKGTDAAAQATYNVPLLNDHDYAEVFANYVSAFKGFQTEFLTKYGDDTATLLQDFSVGYSPTIRDYEEAKWSSERAANSDSGQKITQAMEKFAVASYPGDNLAIPAVAERYADQAYMMRLYFMAEGLVFAAKSEMVETGSLPAKADFFGDDVVEAPKEVGSGKKEKAFPEADTKAGHIRAMEVAKAYMEPRAAAWKKALADRVQRVLEAQFGMTVLTPNGSAAGIGFLRTGDEGRYQAFANDLMPIAAIGARGVQVRRTAEAAQAAITDSIKKIRKCESHGSGNTYELICHSEYPDPAKMSAQQLKDPRGYMGFAPFRTPAQDAGMKDILLPETPDQLSQFFKKKMDVVMAFKAPDVRYAETELTEKLAKNEVVMRGMDNFFGDISKEMDTRSPGGNASAVPSCATTLSSAGIKAERRGKARKPAGLGIGAPAASHLTPEECSKPSNDEAEQRRKTLEASIVPALRKSYENFVKGLRTPGTYRSPERAAKAIEEQKNRPREMLKELRALSRPIQDNLSMRAVNPRLSNLQDEGQKKIEKEKNQAAIAQANRDAEGRRRRGYFRPGRDHSFDKNGGELYLEKEEDRAEAIRLFREALAMIGLAQELDGVAFAYPARGGILPARIQTWSGTERILRDRLAGARLLERMVGTVSDQIAMGQVLTQEAIYRAPILTLQDAWDWKKDEKKSPPLIEKFAKAWSAEKGWNVDAYHSLFRATLDRALQNDRGKVEKFCQADIKNYQSDENFRRMFTAISGIRSMLGTNPEMKEWDAKVLKESRSWAEEIREEYIDPFSTPLMIAIFLVVIVQVVAAFATGGTSLALSGNFFVGVAKFIALQAVGNLGLVTLIFSFQTYCMISTYHYAMPPQMTFTFQVANSRIQNMDGGTRFAGGSMVDRERLNEMREELNAQQVMTNVAIAGEILQFGAFTLPGALKTFGVTGAKRILRLGSASSPDVVAAVKTDSLWKLVREKGLKQGVKEYWEKAGPALKNLRRVASVKGGKGLAQEMKVAKSLREMLGDKLSTLFKDKTELREFYQAVKAEKMKEARILFNASDDQYARVIAKKVKQGPIDFAQVDAKVMDKVAELRKKALRDMREWDALSDAEKLKRPPPLSDDAILVSAQEFENKLLTVPDGWSGQRAFAKATKLSAKAGELDVEVTRLDELLEGLEKSVATDGRTDVQNFFRDNLTVTDIEQHKKFFKKFREKLPERAGDWRRRLGEMRSQIKRAFSDYEYLHEDWTKASPSARAIEGFYKTGQAHLFIDANGDLGAFDPVDFKKHPEKYAVETLPITTFYPEIRKELDRRKEVVEKLKEKLKPRAD